MTIRWAPTGYPDPDRGKPLDRTQQAIVRREIAAIVRKPMTTNQIVSRLWARFPTLAHLLTHDLVNELCHRMVMRSDLAITRQSDLDEETLEFTTPNRRPQ
ncbi:MAG: hypothetical protein M1380_00400 [Chloroflexi bacterium]|nr:hypothetical protein [Chloroflexota bacterium]MCL5026648.1 hypothetical protein [Chloroflexota bacterium]